jgi:hypothetical protein
MPNKGDVITVNRGLYRHYGVYCGNGSVVHFAPKKGFELDAENAMIQKTSLAHFLKGAVCEIEAYGDAAYTPDETVRRAYSLVGTNKGEYNLVFNNCEHFARWCKCGVKRSRQVETAVAVAAVSAAAVVALVVKSIVDRKDDPDGRA